MNEILAVKQWLVAILNERISLLPDTDIIPIEQPVSIENYKLIHPIGAILIIYAGSTFSENKAVNKVVQDRLMKFGLVLKVRNIPGKMAPEIYVQYIIDSLSGLVYKNNTIYFTEDNFMDENAGIWTYYLELIVPTEYVDKQ